MPTCDIAHRSIANHLFPGLAANQEHWGEGPVYLPSMNGQREIRTSSRSRHE